MCMCLVHAHTYVFGRGTRHECPYLHTYTYYTTGRAGRTTAGVCFHLCSRRRFESLREFRESELLTTPLEELCLQAKVLIVRVCMYIVMYMRMLESSQYAHALYPHTHMHMHIKQLLSHHLPPTHMHIRICTYNNSCWASLPATTPSNAGGIRRRRARKSCHKRRRPACRRGDCQVCRFV